MNAINRFSTYAAVILLTLTGCHQEMPVVEPQASIAAASAAAASWTPEQVKIFQEENRKARLGLDDGPVGARAPGVAAPGAATK